MQTPNDVIALAAAGHVKELANELDISLPRTYELLSRDNPYPKLWRLLRPLGRFNPEGLRLVLADFNARAHGILVEHHEHVTTARLHKELSEVIQAVLSRADATQQRREITEAITVLQERLEELDRTTDRTTEPPAIAGGFKKTVGMDRFKPRKGRKTHDR